MRKSPKTQPNGDALGDALERARSGDHYAEINFDKVARPMIRAVLLNRFKFQSATADDLAQEVLITVLDRNTPFTNVGRTNSFLRRLAINKGRQHLRRQDTIGGNHQGGTPISDLVSPETLRSPQNDDSELRVVIRQAVNSLPDKERDIFLARSDYARAEDAAKAFGVSARAVRKRLHSAMNHILEFIKCHAPEAYSEHRAYFLQLRERIPWRLG